jgi:hypothetical protein
VQLVSIEPTPNPNSMKITVDESLPPGVRRTYKKQGVDPLDVGTVDPLLQELVAIEGVASLFRTADFVSVQRDHDQGWEVVLARVREVFATHAHARVPDQLAGASGDPPPAATEVSTGGQVAVQSFRHLPMLVRVTHAEGQVARALPDRFATAVKTAMSASANMLAERLWADWGVRYGEAEAVADQVVGEIEVLYPAGRLQSLTQRALTAAWDQPEARPSTEELIQDLDASDWRRRFRAIRELPADPTLLPQLQVRVGDTHMAVRRQAAVLLGRIQHRSAVECLIALLSDTSAAVRRTAGDALSDLAASAAEPAMRAALEDPSALVRWRAARFLFEVGSDAALPALRAAAADTAFEVSMQARQAIERIEAAVAPAGPVWQQMTGG